MKNLSCKYNELTVRIFSIESTTSYEEDEVVEEEEAEEEVEKEEDERVIFSYQFYILTSSRVPVA